MEGSTLLLIFGIIFLILLLLYIVAAYYYGVTPPLDLVPKLTPLNVKTDLYSSNQATTAFISGAGGTIAGLLNVHMGDRTVALGSTNYTTLLGIVGTVELQLVPANASSPTKSTARLKIGSEVINLPPFPQQTWVFLAIVREGRRFDVVYNNKIVASHRLDNYPTATTNTLQMGGPAFLGNAIHVSIVNRKLNLQELAVLRATYSDTTGAPPTPLPFPFPFTLPSFQNFCLPGLPCNPVTKPPSDSMKQWRSMYS
jgi:hypothetical protein